MLSAMTKTIINAKVFLSLFREHIGTVLLCSYCQAWKHCRTVPLCFRYQCGELEAQAVYAARCQDVRQQGVGGAAHEAAYPNAAADSLPLMPGDQPPEIASVGAKLPNRATARATLAVVDISIRRILKYLLVGKKF